MAETAVSANRLELLQIADAVAREKSIDKIGRAARRWRMRSSAPRVALWRGERDPRRDRPQDRRDAAQPPAAWWSRRSRTRRPRSPSSRRSRTNPAATVGDYHRRAAAAHRFRPHRRAERQAGDRAEGARCRARAPCMTNTRTASARSSTASVKRVEYGNVIVDLGRGEGDRPARRDAAARDLPPRRPHPRLCL